MLGLGKRSIKLDSSFPATLENIDIACTQLVGLLATDDLEHVSFEVLLLAREALSNAVKHGCKLDPKKTVHFRVQLDESELIMEVQDPGPGFDWKRALLKSVLPTSERGRGLPILVYYAQDVKFNRKGNKVSLKKDITCRVRDSYE